MSGSPQLEQARGTVRAIAQLLGSLEDSRTRRVAGTGRTTEDDGNQRLETPAAAATSAIVGGVTPATDLPSQDFQL
jgi:hypothetical protein